MSVHCRKSAPVLEKTSMLLGCNAINKQTSLNKRVLLILNAILNYVPPQTTNQSLDVIAESVKYRSLVCEIGVFNPSSSQNNGLQN